MFQAKTLPPDWELVLASSPSALLEVYASLIKDEARIDENFESIVPSLLKTKLSSNDPSSTPENLVHLFELTQLALEVKSIYLEDAESQIRTLEATLDAQDEELTKLRVLSQGAESARLLKSS